MLIRVHVLDDPQSAASHVTKGDAKDEGIEY